MSTLVKKFSCLKFSVTLGITVASSSVDSKGKEASVNVQKPRKIEVTHETTESSAPWRTQPTNITPFSGGTKTFGGSLSPGKESSNKVRSYVNIYEESPYNFLLHNKGKSIPMY